MKIKLLVLILGTLIPGSLTFAQPDEAKWGKFSKSEIEMMHYPQDTEAVAVVLGDYGEVRYLAVASSRPIRLARHVRIKLLSNTGVDEYGNVELPYYSYNKSSVLHGVKAMVTLKDGSQVKVDKSQIFEDELSDYWSVVKIAFPSLEPGAIIEYKYILESDHTLQPVDWQFQREIPVVLSRLFVQYPDVLSYVQVTQGEHKVVRSDGITQDGFIQSIYHAEQVPALREERFITTMDDYYTRIRYQLQSANIPGHPYQEIMSDWDKLAQDLRDNDGFGKVINNKSQARKLLQDAQIDPEAQNQYTTAKQLYEYIGRTVAWDETYRFTANGSISSMLKEGKAGTGGMNLMLIAGLRAAGIDASPVLASTRTHGGTIELYPIVDQFNQTLVMAELDGETYVIDATNSFRPMGFPRVNSLNYRGWLVRDKSQEWINLDVPMSKSTYFSQLAFTDEDICTGNVQARYTGYAALFERENYSENPDDYDQSDPFMTDVGPVDLAGLQVENEKDPYKPFTCKYEVEVPSIGYGDEFIYFSIPVVESWRENPFKKPNRMFPIDFNFPIEENLIMLLDVPEGYSVEELPGSLQMSSEDGGLRFERSTSETGGKIQVRMKLSVQRLRFRTDEYETVRNFFDQVVFKIGEQIVFKRNT